MPTLYQMETTSTHVFMTLRHSVLLQNLFQAGVRGKCWRLLRNWHSNLTSQVRLGSYSSKTFSICRGIRQGSPVSSWTLYCLL